MSLPMPSRQLSLAIVVLGAAIGLALLVPHIGENGVASTVDEGDRSGSHDPHLAVRTGPDDGDGEAGPTNGDESSDEHPATDLVSAARGREALDRWRKSDRFAWQNPEQVRRFIAELDGGVSDLIALTCSISQEQVPAPVEFHEIPTSDYYLAANVIQTYLRNFAGDHGTARSWVSNRLDDLNALTDVTLRDMLGYASALGVVKWTEEVGVLERELAARMDGGLAPGLIRSLSEYSEDADIVALVATYLTTREFDAIRTEAHAFGSASFVDRVGSGADRLPPDVVESLLDTSERAVRYFAVAVWISRSGVGASAAAEAVRSHIQGMRPLDPGDLVARLLRRFGSEVLDGVRAILAGNPWVRMEPLRAVLEPGLRNLTAAELARELAHGKVAWAMREGHLVRS